jgi:homoserine O-succinyltransferase
VPLVLPAGHPARGAFDEVSAPLDRAPVRIGIVNIMPRLESYEPLLLGPLSRARRTVEPVFLRLASHAYGSSDHAHLDRFYRSFASAVAERPLDGLILTGAPVEELAFEEVNYWSELVGLFEQARVSVRSTLGLCWGGMALGGWLGIPKTIFERKLFGVFENRRLVEGHPLLETQEPVFRCAHSRHSGVSDAALERAAATGRVRLLSHAPSTGYTMFETPDHRFVMHLGHPEYIAERITFEWERDRALGRTDVEAPRDFDTERPTETWSTHRDRLFASWVDLVAPSPGAKPVP